MTFVASGGQVINLHPVINVHTGDFIAGLIGGAVVLAGVFLTEAFVRMRERRRRLEEATWDLATVTLSGASRDPTGEQVTAFIHRLARVRSNARWPLRQADQIVAETNAVFKRLLVDTAKSEANKDDVLNLKDVLGSKLVGLVFPQQQLDREAINKALRAEGLPVLGGAAGTKDAGKR